MQPDQLRTTAQAAAELGRSASWVRLVARRHGIGQVVAIAPNGLRVYGDADLVALRELIRTTRRGRPPRG